MYISLLSWSIQLVNMSDPSPQLSGKPDILHFRKFITVIFLYMFTSHTDTLSWAVSKSTRKKTRMTGSCMPELTCFTSSISWTNHAHYWCKLIARSRKSINRLLTFVVKNWLKLYHPSSIKKNCDCAKINYGI